MTFDRKQYVQEHNRFWEQRHKGPTPRQIAREKGEKFFEGTKCRTCRKTKRYTSSARCVNCAKIRHLKTYIRKPKTYSPGVNGVFEFAPKCKRCGIGDRVRSIKNPNTGKQYWQKYCHPCRVAAQKSGKYWKKNS